MMRLITKLFTILFISQFIHGFLIFPFTAENALNVFYKNIYENGENIDENVMKYSVPGQFCLRDCSDGKSKVCYFKFIIKYYQVMSIACNECMSGNLTSCLIKKCVTADGFQRGFLSINFQLPGPTIAVCKNDIVVVDVFNEAEGLATSIHWHGIKQVKSQFSDGVPYLTQCPIPYFSQYRYIFKADDAGTHFYHSHSGNQKADGIHGALIVREPKNNKFYDFDLPQHIIFTSDWMHDFSDNYLPGMAKRSALTESMLVNGRGKYRNSNGEFTKTPITIFYVEQGKRFRFRLINSATNVCPYQFQIENHNFTVIATELSHIKPIVANTIHYLSGERYDIVIDANQPVRDYWIRIRELDPCWKKIEAFAILRYQKSPVKVLQPKIIFNETPIPNWEETYPKGILFNSLKPKIEDIAITEAEAYNNDGDDELLLSQPDHIYHLFIDSPTIMNSIMYEKKNLKDYTFLTSELISNASFVAIVNNITLQYPPFPLLLEQDKIDDSLFCNGHSLQNKECLNGGNYTICKCIHRLKVDLGSKVELIIYNINDKISHPLHLHGHKFQVIDSGIFKDPKDKSEANKKLNLKGKKFPYKDTTTIGFPGFIRLRFRANNPGFWLMHCHFDWHLSIGMAVIIQVGEVSQMPKPKPNIPRCHPYTPLSMK
ncbi:hypothetical protein PVAND_013045 [Polypedilum vanderplanki]|uniref:Multicopper oxidase n=1 Tax=Polypedilum vanderplanki TaxID=319348 RepID=A0A9J6CP76_POLVA|nr:hypothetical protein PVAND_013045 [Polypedilum vanderplanki]